MTRKERKGRSKLYKIRKRLYIVKIEHLNKMSNIYFVIEERQKVVKTKGKAQNNKLRNLQNTGWWEERGGSKTGVKS